MTRSSIRPLSQILMVSVIALVGYSFSPQASASEAPRLSVEGKVQRYFESSDGVQLVELKLRHVLLAEARQIAPEVRIPAPGDTLYLRLTRRSAGGRPAVGHLVRAQLQSAGGGAWAAIGDSLKPLANDGNTTQTPTAGQASATVNAFGVSWLAKRVGGRLGLEVTQVEEGSAAQQLGFQPGDIVVGVNGRPLTSAEDLERPNADRSKIQLEVIDVNTGRTATVNVPMELVPVGDPSPTFESKPTPPAGSTERILVSLGLEVGSTRVGLRHGLRVQAVKDGAGASKSGVEPGDVILAVGDTLVTSVDEFAQALPNRPTELTLVVKDVRTGREVPVEVLSARVPESGVSTPSPASTRRPSSRNAPAQSKQAGDPARLGIRGELTFYDAEAAVRVTDVVPGSAAARAGVRPGMILTSANGSPLMHPNDLAAAIENARGTVTLRLVDPATRQEESIQVKL